MLRGKGDLYRHNGTTATNLTNNALDQHSIYEGGWGADIVYRTEDETAGTFPTVLFMDLYRHSGAAATKLTSNTGGRHSYYEAAWGANIVYRTELYGVVSPPVVGLLRQDLYRHDGTTATNLTNNIDKQYSHYETAWGANIVYRTVDTIGVGSDAEKIHDLYRHDGTTATNLTNNVTGQQSTYETQWGGDIVYRTLDRSAGSATDVSMTDLYRHNGVTATNLTNHGPGLRSEFETHWGGDIIYRTRDYNGAATSDDTITDLCRHNGVTATNLTNNAAAHHSIDPFTWGAYLVYMTVDYSGGTDPHEMVADIFVHDGTSAINLTNNVPGSISMAGDWDGAAACPVLYGGTARYDAAGDQVAADLFAYYEGTLYPLTSNPDGYFSGFEYLGADSVMWVTISSDRSVLYRSRLVWPEERAIPEPGSAALMLLGAAGLVRKRRRA